MKTLITNNGSKSYWTVINAPGNLSQRPFGTANNDVEAQSAADEFISLVERSRGLYRQGGQHGR